MLTADELASMRITHGEALPDECIVTRPNGPAEFNPATGQHETTSPDTVYAGPCRVRPFTTTSERVVLLSELPVTTTRYRCTLPHDADGIKIGDVWTGTTSTDVRLVDETMRVADVIVGSNNIGRYLVLEAQEAR